MKGRRWSREYQNAELNIGPTSVLPSSLLPSASLSQLQLSHSVIRPPITSQTERSTSSNSHHKLWILLLHLPSVDLPEPSLPPPPFRRPPQERMRFPRVNVFLTVHHYQISKLLVLLPYPPLGLEAFWTTEDELELCPKGTFCWPVLFVARLIAEEVSTVDFVRC